jgi:hypothetical protein
MLLSFVLSLSACSLYCYLTSRHQCNLSMSNLATLLAIGWDEQKEIGGALFMAAVIIAMPVYDLISVIRFFLAWDQQLNDLKLRPGGPWVVSTAAPDSRRTKIFIYLAFCSAAIIFIIHRIPSLICLALNPLPIPR